VHGERGEQGKDDYNIFSLILSLKFLRIEEIMIKESAKIIYINLGQI
jgi:hypothetical protein